MCPKRSSRPLRTRATHLIQQGIHRPLQSQDAKYTVHRVLPRAAFSHDYAPFAEIEGHWCPRVQTELVPHTHGNGHLTLSRDCALHTFKVKRITKDVKLTATPLSATPSRAGALSFTKAPEIIHCVFITARYPGR